MQWSLVKGAALLLSAVLACAAEAAQYRVGTTEELDDALLEVDDGDEIILKAGVYTLQAEVDARGVTLRGDTKLVFEGSVLY